MPHEPSSRRPSGGAGDPAVSVHAHDRGNPLATDDIREEDLRYGYPPPEDPPDWLAWGFVPGCNWSGHWPAREAAIEGWFYYLLSALVAVSPGMGERGRLARWQRAVRMCNAGVVDPHAMRALFRLGPHYARIAARAAGGWPHDLRA